jgi:sugar transferase EpsL
MTARPTCGEVSIERMLSSSKAKSVKRALDVTLATCGLIAFAPLMAAAAVAIRLTMGPPVLFRQPRPGLGGQPFTILKFRSMSNGTGPQGDLLSEGDRQTALGRWMRKTSFDELPELLNVIRGEMSIVGPRPLLMKYLPLYNDEQMRRHDARPGITGLAQIRGRHTVPWETRFELDTWYVDHWSLRLDALVLRETLKVVFRGQHFEHGHGSEPFTWTGNDDGR